MPMTRRIVAALPASPLLQPYSPCREYCIALHSNKRVRF
jgi:hypothetical protein